MIPLQYVLIAVVSCLGTCPAFRTECNCICDRKDLCESVRSMKTAVDSNVNHLRQWTRHSNFVQRIHERWDDEVESVVRQEWEVRLNETRGLLNSCLASQKEAEKSIQKISLSMETLEKQVNDNLTAIMRSVENSLETFKKEFANVSKQHITDKKEDLLEATCDEPQPPKHGSVKLHGELKVGSIATYSCDPDRKLYGATTTKCLISGKWTFDAPDCLSTCTVPFIENGEIGRYETRYTRWSSHEEFKKVVAGSIVNSDETLFFRCKGDFLPLEGSQFVTSNRLEVTCNDGTWSKDLQCKPTEEDRSISSLGPRVTPSTTEIPTNVNLEASTRDTSGLIPNKDCSCTYEHEDESVNAQIGNKILKFGDEIKIGEKVSFQCKYPRTFLKFQNGLRLQSTANMTCTACKKWKKTDVPICENSEQSDTFIGFGENLNILPGGNTSIQQGVIHQFSCINIWKQPDWHYGQRKGVSVRRTSVSESGRLNIYITYLDIQKEATELNGEYECYIYDDQGHRKSTFLHLQVTGTCTVSFIENGEIGRYETRYTRSSSHEEFKKVVAGSNVNSDETLFFRCKGDFLPLEGSQFVTSNRLEVTCNDGTWSKDLQCKPSVRCKLITTGDLLQVDYSLAREVGSYAAFHCPVPGKRSGVSLTRCLENGTWADPTPTCKNNFVCAYPPDIEGAVTPLLQGNEHPLGTTITYSCPLGYVSRNSNNHISVCRFNKGTRKAKWTTPKISCNRIIYCNAPTNPVNGRVSYSSLEYGTELKYECNAGFLLKKHPPRICFEDGSWSNEEPECIDSKCSIGDLSQIVPENVVPDISEDVEEHVTIGSLVRLKCNDNKIMTGEREAQCGEEGKWKLGSLQCVPGCILDLDPSPRLLVQPMKDSYRVGEFVFLSCPPGQEMSNKIERLMCVFGGWSDSLPECIPH